VNIILENTDQVAYFTNMKQVFSALNISASDYDWYVSDIETNFSSSDFTQEDKWISGEDLSCFLENNEIQFIWAVFSALPKGLRPTIHESPYIEGNPEYWSGKVISTQLSDALFEIACWDSSATILVGLPEKAESAFILRYPDTRPLVSAAR
jgi:hypothetical protein